MTAWSDSRKWWMDVLKSVVTAVIGFGIAYLLLDRLQEAKNESRAVCLADVERQRSLRDEFRRTGFAYVSATEEAYNELYRWRDEQPTQPIKHWWGSAYDDFFISIQNLEKYTVVKPEIKKDVSHIKYTIEEIYNFIDRRLIDRRLDAISGFYDWNWNPEALNSKLQNPIYLRALAPISRGILREQQVEVNKFARELRTQIDLIADKIDSALAMGATDVCKKLRMLRSEQR